MLSQFVLLRGYVVSTVDHEQYRSC